MADTAIAITAGAGTNIDTRTESTNSNHRQVVVLGDPTTNAGVAPVDVTTGLVVNIGPGVDLGSGTSGSKTQRVIVDSSQLGALGANTSANSVAVALASDQKFFANGYETVAASQTAQVMGGSGATGDYIAGVLVIPATTSPGNVLLLDNATSITIFTGGATSVSNLVPFMIPLGMVSASGAWKITTGANVSCIGIGKFS